MRTNAAHMYRPAFFCQMIATTTVKTAFLEKTRQKNEERGLTNGENSDIIMECRKEATSGCGAVGSALPWGGRGRKFKSCHSDQIKPKTNRFRLYFLHFGAKSGIFPPLPHLQRFRKFFDHMFDHSWSWCDSFGCFCFGTLCSKN